MSEELKKFLKEFESAKEFFLNGKCYWFAEILKKRFKGQMMYNPIDNHWAVLIDEKLYDVTGEIVSEGYYKWPGSFTLDPLHYRRLRRDCIDYWPPYE